MMRYKYAVFAGLAGMFLGFSQDGVEREHRILRTQFPQNAREYLTDNLSGIRKTRFYKEVDSTGANFTARFKKDRLYYDIEFDPKGEIRHIAFRVRQVDLPGESWDAITAFLSESFTKYRIRTIQQRYTVSPEGTPEGTLRQALQNLILPTVDYEITLIGKMGKHREGYVLLFDASGTLRWKRRQLPANHDHVLY